MRGIASAAVATCLLVCSSTVHAANEPAPTLRSQVYSPYEQGAIDAALADGARSIDPAPEGKTLEGIDIVTLDVIDARDPAPAIINVFHATTRRYVVDREILLRPGEPYQTVAVEESVRNLRALPQLSLVLAVAVRGKKPGGVRLLVITKDVWSLRLAWDLQAGPGGVEDFVIQPSETNFLGTHQVALLNFEMDPATLSYGVGYHVPRLEGTRNVLNASAQLTFNRATGAAEGSSGSLLAYQPLFSAKTKWAWDSAVTWDQEISRRFVNAREGYYEASVGGANDLVPFEYFVRTYYAQESVTRSFGWDVKHDLSLGGFVDLREYRTTAAQAGADPAALAEFAARNIPESVNRVAPFVEYHGYRTRFIRVLDFQTLGLQEDYRLGHEAYVRVYPMPKALGSSSDQVGLYAALAYTVAMGEGLARGIVESTTEGQPGSPVSQGTLGGGGEIVTPRLGLGRFVYDFYALSRYKNALNLETYLGGDSRLRGYPSNFFVGSDIVVSNLEFRTRPVELLHTVELGADFFYDVGDVAFGFNNLHPKQGVGLGLRALFPQLDREVFRFDVGFPIGYGATLAGVAPVTFFVAFQQAFVMPAPAGAALPSGAASN